MIYFTDVIGEFRWYRKKIEDEEISLEEPSEIAYSIAQKYGYTFIGHVGIGDGPKDIVVLGRKNAHIDEKGYRIFLANFKDLGLCTKNISTWFDTDNMLIPCSFIYESTSSEGGRAVLEPNTTESRPFAMTYYNTVNGDVRLGLSYNYPSNHGGKIISLSRSLGMEPKEQKTDIPEVFIKAFEDPKDYDTS